MSNVSLSETCWIASLFFHLLDDWLIWFNAFNSKLNDLTWWLKYPQIRTIWWNGYRQVWTISNIVRHIFILNLWDRKFPQTYFISVAMAQEISRTKHWFLTFAVKIFLFGAMRQWWWRLRGTFVACWPTCSYFFNFHIFCSYDFDDQSYFPVYWIVLVYFDSSGSLHCLCSTCFRLRLIQRDFDRQYLSYLRRTFDICPTIH